MCWVTSRMAVWFGTQLLTSSFLSLLEQIGAAKTTYLGEMNHNRKQGFILALLSDCTVFKQLMGDLNRVGARIVNESSMNPQFSDAVNNSLALNKCLTVTVAVGLVPSLMVISITQLLPWKHDSPECGKKELWNRAGKCCCGQMITVGRWWHVG